MMLLDSKENKEEWVDLKEWDIYFIQKWDKFDTLWESIDPKFAWIVNNWHYCIIAEVGEYIGILCFSSRFFKSIFIKEVWDLYPFLNTCSCLCPLHRISDLETSNPIFYKTIKKYNPKQSKTPRKNIFIPNKEDYNFLSQESFINISKIERIKSNNFHSYLNKQAIKCEYVWRLKEWDKKMMLAQIRINLEEDDKNGIQSLDNEILRELLKRWW